MKKNQTTRVRRAITPQFKRGAVKLVNEGKTFSEVARDLRIQFIATKRPV
jgi:transposase-like protein